MIPKDMRNASRRTIDLTRLLRSRISLTEGTLTCEGDFQEFLDLLNNQNKQPKAVKTISTKR